MPLAPWRRNFERNDVSYPTLNTPMGLPLARQIISGETYSTPWDASVTGPGAAIERPPRRTQRRVRDVAFGFAMAIVVAAVFYIGARGWLFGAQ